MVHAARRASTGGGQRIRWLTLTWPHDAALLESTLASRAWIAYLAVAVGASGLYCSARFPGHGPLSIYLRVVGASRSSSGIRILRPAAPWPWRWFAIGAGAVLPRGRLHVQLSDPDRPRGAVPVSRGRSLHPRVPGADDRRCCWPCAAATRRAIARGDRHAHHHRRHRAPLLGLPDGAVRARRHALASCEGVRSPTRSATCSCSRLPCASPSTAAAPRLFRAAGGEHRRAADNGRGLRLRAARRDLQPPAGLRRRMAAVLPPVGRSGTASVDAAFVEAARTASAGCPAAPRPAHGGLAGRPCDRVRPRRRIAAISTCCVIVGASIVVFLLVDRAGRGLVKQNERTVTRERGAAPRQPRAVKATTRAIISAAALEHGSSCSSTAPATRASASSARPASPRDDSAVRSVLPRPYRRAPGSGPPRRRAPRRASAGRPRRAGSPGALRPRQRLPLGGREDQRGLLIAAAPTPFSPILLDRSTRSAQASRWRSRAPRSASRYTDGRTRRASHRSYAMRAS